jgi:CHAT domain-containing protein/tetratricopeptide (TPR) repeat protein
MLRLRRPPISNLICTSVVLALLVPGGMASARALYNQNPLTAEQHRETARRLRSAAEYPAALVHAQLAVQLDEDAAVPDETALAESLVLLGQISDAIAQFDAAEGHYLRARRIVESSSNPKELLKASVFDALAAHLILRARFQQAEPLARDALAIRERLAATEPGIVAQSLATLTDLEHERSNVQEAAVMAQRAYDVAARAYSPTSIELGDFTNRLARAHIALGNYPRAEELYRESLVVREAAAGPDSLAAAESIGGLARVALLANDNAASEERHRRSLAIRERVFGPDHPQVANDVFNLGLISYRRRDFKNAVELYSRALAIRQRSFGGSHPAIAITLNNLGLVYWRQGDYARAEEFFGRSLALSEQLYGAESLRVTNALGNLGIIAKEVGDYAKAESHYRRALAIKEKHLGSQHPELITLVESLGILYRDRSQYVQAEEMFQRTISLTAGSLGPEHPFVARHLGNLSQMYWAAGQWEKAFSARQQVVAIEERNLPLELSGGSERQKLAFIGPLMEDLDETITLHIQQPPGHAGARDLALTTLLQRKGRVFDALADNIGAFRKRATPDDLAVLDQLVRVTSELAAAVLSESTGESAVNRQRKIGRLTEHREQLEIQMQRRSAGYLSPSAPVTLAAVQNAIPLSAALIEYAVYRPFDPRASVESGRRYGPPRYVVYVLHHSGGAQWNDLGPAETIDRAVDRMRASLADPARVDITQRARELHQLVLAPLESMLAETTHLLISPDGPLHLVPFEALRTDRGRYVLEDHLVSYLTTGRDLLRVSAARPAPGASAIFADPAFGRSRPQATASFARLAGTAAEAKRILAALPDGSVRLGDAASEHAVKRLQAPRVLHLATHGIFQSGNLQQKPTENPLLLSGLALADANVGQSYGEDGILTALEAANLDLWGTKLVTLSACNTGMGVIRNGEGVYGLRRAFFLAGAETVVMSLWPVSDLVTRDIMADYYRGLEDGLGRGDALRRVQLRLRQQPGRGHPFYWAGFIQAGEWANLDGQR